MTIWRLVFKSLTFHARSHLGALLGAAVGTAVLTGALLVGDSVRGSLGTMALQRLGNVELALPANDRLVRRELASEIESSLRSESGRSNIQVVAVLQLPGTAAAADGSARANQVQVLGVEPEFWKLASGSVATSDLPPDGVLLNTALAAQLKAGPGDSVVLRVEKPSQLSRDAPMSAEEDVTVAIRATVHGIVSDAELGRFSLLANQIPPFNAFLPIELLQSRTAVTNRVNLLLVSVDAATPSDAANLQANAQAALRRKWQLADASLELRGITNTSQLELRSSRVFMDAPVTAAAKSIHNDATGVLTYLVNELRLGDRAIPYSMVSAVEPPFAPSSLAPDQIILNQWAADDLGAKPGDEVALAYYIVGSMRELEERHARFRVHSILPMNSPGLDASLMPDFPGLTDADNCRDWDTGFAIQMDRIREKDEKYWDDYRGTPKALIALASGQELWANRFGDLTAVRFPAGASSLTNVSQQLMAQLDPESLGLTFEPVRERALRASAQSQDFGGLFIGFSFFLVVAALLLMAMLFQFGVEQRSTEIGTLLALGFTPKRVRRLLLAEATLLAILGSVVGLIAAIGYAKAMLHGLSTIWRQAIGTSDLSYFASPATLLIGGAAGSFVAVVTIAMALRRQGRQPARELLALGAVEATRSEARAGQGKAAWVAGVSLIGAILVGGAASRQDQTSAGAFFGAGALVLVGGIAAGAMLLRMLESRTGAVPTLTGLGLRNATRRRKRSLATMALLACGSFLILSIGVFRLDSETGKGERSSGTGGFALIGQTTQPLVRDLNSDAGRVALGLEGRDLEGVSVVPFRVRDGEDASCLNLNRAQAPRLLGVRPRLLKERGAFTFTKASAGLDTAAGWDLLNHKTADNSVPAIGDAASIQWALGKKIGDTLTYKDAHGNDFQVRLVGAIANSILQGNLVIAEEQFEKLFPGEYGYRMFLIDAPSNAAEKTAETLSRALVDVGMEIVTSTDRLAAFNAVQNTYLSTFQVLGGLGLLLGSVGLGVVVLRNVLERRSELALLLAVGFRSPRLRWLVLSEHGALLILGLGLGVLAAAIAVAPAILSPSAAPFPYSSLAITLGGVLLSGALWTWLATHWALRGKLLETLRNN